MSARGRRKATPPAGVLLVEDAAPTEVAAFEFYPTPRPAILSLLESPLIKLPGGTWLDPCAGTGRIPSTVNSYRGDVSWLLCEIDTRHEGALRQLARPSVDELLPFGDFVIRDWDSPIADVCIMNPPFSHAQKFVEAAFDRARWVVMLQRTNWIAPARAAWLRQHAPDVYALDARPSFTGDGKTDAAEYSWFVWPPNGRNRRAGTCAMLGGGGPQLQLLGGAA